MDQEVNTVLTDFCYLECPRWHENRIWFSDFYTYRVYSATEDGEDLRVEAEVPQQPSGLGWLPDGRLLIVSMRDGRVLRREHDDTLETHADLSGHTGENLNDMVVDTHGRAFVGEFGFDLMNGAPLATASLLRVDSDGSVSRVAEDLWFPNGTVITDDQVLLVCETFANRVTAFDITGTGSLTNRRTWAQFGDSPTERDLERLLAQVVVGADGCCLDTSGALWIADAVGGRVLRVHEGGDIDQEIRPGDGVFACMLGGSDGRTLYLCTAPDFHEETRKQVREGRLLSTRTESPHAGLP